MALSEKFQLVFVQTEADKTYFEEIDRITTENNSRLHPTASLKFVAVSSKTCSDEYQTEFSVKKELLEIYRLEIESRIQSYHSEMCSKLNIIDEQKLKKILSALEIELPTIDNNQELKNLAEQTVNKIYNLIKINVEKKIQDEQLKIQIRRNEEAALLVRTLVKHFNDRSVSEIKSIGILNARNLEPNTSEQSMIFTQRHFLEFYVFDPLNVFFVLEKETPDKVKELLNNLSDRNRQQLNEGLEKLNLKISNWNSFLGQKSNEKDLWNIFEAVANIISNLIQDKLVGELSENTHDAKKEVCFICSCGELKIFYYPMFLECTKHSFVKAISELLHDTKIFEQPILGCSTDEICSKMLEYLKQNKYNFLVPREFRNKFQQNINQNRKSIGANTNV